MVKLTYMLCGLTLWIATHPAAASMVEPLSVDRLCTRAATIIDAEVVDIKTTWSNEARGPITTVRLKVNQVLKGHNVPAEVSLVYPVGTANGIERSIEGIEIPFAGERGIYFLAEGSKSTGALMHPLTGWSQGHFIVVPNAWKDTLEVVRADGAQERMDRGAFVQLIGSKANS